RNAGKHFDVVKSQLENTVLKLSKLDFEKITLAYEPVWAIGTGVTATKEEAQEMHAFIRNLITEKHDAVTADECFILYGGSCNANNAHELFSQADVDGGLIGGASLNATEFLKIIDIAESITANA
ncbi:MAG: triose-phosphate isomerase, partial [Bacteroidales bacterium]|nr:triose-phosphate isomerase [Bacteroidales bacterium]